MQKWTSYCLTVASSWSSDIEYLFWKVQVFFVSGCWAISCDFGVFMRGGELKSFYSTILSLPPVLKKHFKTVRICPSRWYRASLAHWLLVRCAKCPQALGGREERDQGCLPSCHLHIQRPWAGPAPFSHARSECLWDGLSSILQQLALSSSGSSCLPGPLGPRATISMALLVA